MVDPILMRQLLERARALGLPVVDEYANKAGEAWRDIKADPLGAAKQAGIGAAAGFAGTPMDLARMAYDGSPMGLASKVATRLSGMDPMPEKTPGGTDWILEKFAPAPTSAGERAAQFAGTIAAPSPQGVARSMKGAVSKIFAGAKSATADQDLLDKARDMNARGASREDVWSSTGWFRGPDAKWRYEIDDSTSQALPIAGGAFEDLRRGNSTIAPIEDVFSHPELAKAYPGTAGGFGPGDKRLVARIRSGGGEGGAFHPHEGRIDVGDVTSLDGNTRKVQRSTMLHELQHAVQEREGFARGTNPEAAAAPVIDRLNKRLNSISKAKDQLEALKLAPGTDPKQFEEQMKALEKKYRDTLDERSDVNPFELYMQSAGEAEARAVQRRKDFTPIQRKLSPPWLSYDRPEDALIVNLPSGTATKGRRP